MAKKYGLLFNYKNGKSERVFYSSESIRDAAFRPWKKKLSTYTGRVTSPVKNVSKIQEDE